MNSFLDKTGLTYLWGKIKATFSTIANTVTSLGTSGNYLTWTKNGTTNNITVPYATNAGSTSKLGSSTVGSSTMPIYLNNGTPTQITSFPEAELSWGGKNLANAYSPVDAAMIGSLGANRWAFLPAAQISIEYTLDGGVTWLDYDGLSDGNKTALFTDNISTNIWLGHNSEKHAITTDELLRITVNCSPDGGATSNMYQYINKFAIFSSGNDRLGRYVTILGRTETNVESNVDTWVTLVDKAIIGGNSGWSIINTNEIKLFGNTYKQFYGQIRFIFGQNLPTTSDYTYFVSRIHAYGMAWTAPSDMAMKGSLFTWNYTQDAYFPGHIIPNGTRRSLGTTSNRWDSIFSSYGNFSGNVNIANNLSVTGTTILTGLLTANGGIVVPSGKTITVDGKEVLTEHQDTSGLVPTTRTINGKALSANINLTASEVGAGTYSKPSDGIPKTDLASAVQTSLGKADTALQSYTETDPVFTASAAHGITSANITSWNNKVSNVQADWNATSGLAVILNKPTNLVTTSAMNTALNGYLPLAGGTMTGRLIARDIGSGWGNGFKPSQSAITFPAIDDILYHPYLHGTSSDGSVWNLGGYQTRVGIYGYFAGHTSDKTDWRTWWDTTNGYLTHSGGMEVGGQITSSVANGTAPLVIASSTLVSNLNADKLDGVDASGLFTELENSENNISLTIGGTNKTLTVGYASTSGQASISKKAGDSWTSVVTIGEWSKVLKISGYAAILLSVRLNLSSQSANVTYLINNAYNYARIVQIGTGGYAINSSFDIRITRSGTTTIDVEIKTSYSSQSETTQNVVCHAVNIHNSGTLTPYTSYTEGSGTLVDSFTSYSRYSFIGNSLRLNGGSTKTTSPDLYIAGTSWFGGAIKVGNAYIWWDDTNSCLRITGADSSGNPSASIATNLNVSGMVAVYSGSSAPSSSMGNDGDIYIQTS